MLSNQNRLSEELPCNGAFTCLHTLLLFWLVLSHTRQHKNKSSGEHWSYICGLFRDLLGKGVSLEAAESKVIVPVTRLLSRTDSKVTVKHQRGGWQAARCEKIVLVTTIINLIREE